MEILQEELREYYQSLLDLGFRLNKEDILDIDVDKNDVRVSYKVLVEDDGYNFVKEQEKKLIDLDANDIVGACNYQKMIDNEHSRRYFEAVKVIGEVFRIDEEKLRLNNRLVEEFKKANNSGKFELMTLEEEVDEDSELVTKAKSFIKDKFAYIAGAALVGGAVIYALSNSGDKQVATYEAPVEIQKEVTEEENTPVVEEETTVEEETAPVVEEETSIEEVVDEETVVEFDINNDEAINATVDKIYNDIQAMDDENFKAEMDKDTIEALVRYTRHSNSEYTGMNIISNEYAYELLTEFFKRGYNIANFYENLDNFDKLNDLVTKSFEIKNDKESYDDELAVYSSLDFAMNTLESDNYPEVIALRTVVDNVTVIDSMKLVASIGEENGLEGEEYNTEKAKAFNVDAKELFNKVDINNENAPLTQATYKAIEEDETLGLGR